MFNKIKNLNKKIWNYFLQSNTNKFLWIKISIFCIIVTITLTIIFTLRHRFQPYLDEGIIEETGFININVIANQGIGFGSLNNKTTAVYVLQSVVMIIIFICLLFTNGKKFDFVITLSFVVSGSLGNIVDRATSTIENKPHAVLDYFQFWFGGAIFNFADTCIVVNFIVLGIAYFIRLMIDLIKESKTKKNKK